MGKHNQSTVQGVRNNQDDGGKDRHASGHDRIANDTRVPLHENVIRHDPLPCIANSGTRLAPAIRKTNPSQIESVQPLDI